MKTRDDEEKAGHTAQEDNCGLLQDVSMRGEWKHSDGLTICGSLPCIL